MKRFKMQPYNFGELAQIYYPDHNYDSALRLFREEMYLTRGMWKAMRAEGYKENTKITHPSASAHDSAVPRRAVSDTLCRITEDPR